MDMMIMQGSFQGLSHGEVRAQWSWQQTDNAMQTSYCREQNRLVCLKNTWEEEINMVM